MSSPRKSVDVEPKQPKDSELSKKQQTQQPEPNASEHDRDISLVFCGSLLLRPSEICSVIHRWDDAEYFGESPRQRHIQWRCFHGNFARTNTRQGAYAFWNALTTRLHTTCRAVRKRKRRSKKWEVQNRSASHALRQCGYGFNLMKSQQHLAKSGKFFDSSQKSFD